MFPFRARRILLLVAIAATAIAVLSRASTAQEREIKTEQADKLDAVLVLDGSASMRITDPEKLRDEGSKLLMQFLHPGDRIAVVGFSDGSNVVRPFTDVGALGSSIASDLSKVGNSGAYTNLLEGVRAAKKLIGESARPDAKPVVILLSDGKMEPPPAVGSPEKLTSELLDTELPELKTKGVKVHTLGFSDQADRELLGQIAAATEGIFWFAPTADKIHEAFSELFLVVKRPQVMALSAKGIKIDADVQEATFYVNREDASEVILTPPKGERYTETNHPAEVKWFAGKKFDVITVPHPMVGDWKVTGVSPNDGFATVITNLKLVTEWPTSFHSSEGTLLQARLYDNDKPIVLREISSVTKYAYQIIPTDKVSEPIIREFLVDDGTNGDKIANDGVFSSSVTLDDPGEYKLTVIAKAPTFQRSQQIPFRVKLRLVSLSVQSDEGHSEAGHDAHGGGHGDEHGGDAGGHEDGPRFQVVLSAELLGMKSMDLKLFAADAERRKLSLPLTRMDDKGLVFSAPVSLLPRHGAYTLVAELVGERKKEGKVKTSSNELEFNYHPKGDEEEESHAIEVVVEQPKKVVQGEPSPLVQIIVMTVLNLLAAGAAILLLKRQSSGGASALPPIESTAPLATLLESLKSRLDSSEVNFDDPIFQDTGSDSSGAGDEDGAQA